MKKPHIVLTVPFTPHATGYLLLYFGALLLLLRARDVFLPFAG